jgi:hypothetical protein
MNRTHRDLSDYFDSFRATHEMSEQQALDLLDRVSEKDPLTPDPVVPPATEKRKRGMLYFSLVIAALLSSAILIDSRWSGSRVEVPVALPSLASHLNTVLPPDTVPVEDTPPRSAIPSPVKPLRYPRTHTDRGMNPPMHSGLLKYPAVKERSTIAPKPFVPKGDSATVDTVFRKSPVETNPPTPIIRGKIEMSGTHVIDLTESELREFGIVAEEKGFAMFYQGDANKIGWLWLGGYRNSRLDIDTLPPATSNTAILIVAPILITRRNGELYMLMTNDKMAPNELERMREARNRDEQQKATVQWRTEVKRYLGDESPTFIPILLRTGSGAGGPEDDDLLLWFTPEPGIIAALPDRVRSEIEIELKRAGDFKRGTMTQGQLLIASPTPMLDVLRSVDGAVVKSTLTQELIAPTMPATKPVARCALELTLAEPRTLRVELFDIQGRRLDQLVGVRDFVTGIQTVGFDITGYPSGMYLVVISSDKQERVVHRVFL